MFFAILPVHLNHSLTYNIHLGTCHSQYQQKNWDDAALKKAKKLLNPTTVPCYSF